MGYVRFGLKDPRQALPGTILISSHHDHMEMVLPQSPVSMDATTRPSVLYASVHPQDADGFEELRNAVYRLALNDTGLDVQTTSSVGQAGEGGGPFLGPGLRVGFQGLLHAEVFRQRLLDEYQIHAVVTPPKVPYTITYLPSRTNRLTEPYSVVVEDLTDWPAPGSNFRVQEPVVHVRIVARVEDAGAVMELITRKRGTDMMTEPIDKEKWMFTANVPWAECVTDFHDLLKNVTAGFGSMDVRDAEIPLQVADLSKVDILLNGEAVDPLAFVCHKNVAQAEARYVFGYRGGRCLAAERAISTLLFGFDRVVCKKLQAVLPRQQFVTVIQAKASGKIIASERIKAYRKDVLTKSGKTVGGGDMTRKMKLLEKQKKGKKRMQQSGRVTLSQAAFNSVISRSS